MSQVTRYSNGSEHFPHPLPRLPKPLLSVLVAGFSLLLIAALSSCSPTQKPETIKLWEFPRWRETADSIDRFAWMKRQVAAFEALHPGVSVELTELTWERGEDKKRIAIAAGVGPDVITGVLPVEMVENGLVEPVDDYMTLDEKEDFYSSALDAFTYGRKTYGWPWYLTGSVMFLNLDLFEQAGVRPPEATWSYDIFLDCTRRLTRDTDDDGEPDVYGFGFLVQPGDTSVWPFLFPDGFRLPLEHPHFENDRNGGAEAGLSQLYELIHRERVAPAQCAGWDTEALWQRFTNQRDIAMAPWGIWAIPKLRTVPGFTFTVLPYPAASEPGSVERTRAFIGTAGFVVLRQSDERKRALCMELARFLTRPEAQKDLVHYGVFPSRKSAGNIYANDELMVRAQEIITSGQTVPQHRFWARIDEKLQREFQLALLGEKSVEAAISDGTLHVRKILEQAKRQPPSKAVGTRKGGTRLLVSGILLLGAFLFISAAVVARKSSGALASAWVFLCPAVIVFLIFLLFPLGWVMLLAFQNYSLAGAPPTWAGLENLKSALREPVFMRAAFNTLVYAAVVVPVNTFSALAVASLIYPLSNRARAFFRSAYYLPGVASVLVIAMVWRWLFNESFGLFNTALGFLGLPGVRWLTDPDIALWSVILTSVARPPGGPILIYLAALDAIPTSLFDAAEIDGAGPLRKWWNVTVPLLRPTTLFIALTITIASFQVFAQVFVLTDGGPGYATEVVVHRIYTAAIRDFEFGAASAMSLILFCVIMLVSIVQYRFLRSEVQY